MVRNKKGALEEHRKRLKNKPLQTRVFTIVLLGGCMMTLVSTVMTLIEGVGIRATALSLMCFCVFVMGVISVFVFKKEAACRLVMCILLNFLLLPMTFFFSGGVRSGNILYFLTALYLIVPSFNSRKVRVIMYMSSLAALIITLELSYHWMSDFVMPVSDDAWHIDVFASLVINALCIYGVSTMVVKAYQDERTEKQQLVDQLEKLAVRDELTGVYNRRELFRVLEEKVMKAPADDLHCMFIFDVDDFRSINDTYGHVFGDKVLCEVARCIQEATGEIEDGELAARYSGEEFVAIFHDDNFDTSYDRAEKVRQEVEKLRFMDNPDVRVTISGGVDRCNGMRPRYALRQVDDLLYLAKTTGKNQVTRKV